MKTKIILTSIGMLSAIAVNAQRLAPSIGINAGFAATMFQNAYYREHNKNSNIQLTPNFGLQFELSNPERSDVYFGLGLQYSNYKQDYNVGDPTAFGEFAYLRESKAAISYLQIPVTIGYSFKAGRINPYINLGAAPSLLLDFKQENQSGSFMGAPLYETIDKTGVEMKSVPGAIIGGKIEYNEGGYIYKTFNVFAIAQMGVNINLSEKILLNLGLSYQQSLQTIENHNSFSMGYWGYNDFYKSRGITESELTVMSPGKQQTTIEKANKYNTKLASVGLNAGISFQF